MYLQVTYLPVALFTRTLILYANTYTILDQELDRDSSSDLTFEYILPACARISHALESRFEPFLPLVSIWLAISCMVCSELYSGVYVYYVVYILCT